jgi:hypothetical protein
MHTSEGSSSTEASKDRWIFNCEHCPFSKCLNNNRQTSFHLSTIPYPFISLSSVASFNDTPLHLACCFLNQSPAILQVLLDRSPVQVLGLQDDGGDTPLHMAYLNRVYVDIIRQMIRLYPKALRMFSKAGNAPLHYGNTPLRLVGLSPESSLEKLELLILHCPEVCLVLNNQIESPFDSEVDQRAFAPQGLGTALLQAITINVLLAFLVCMRQTLVTVSLAVMTHIRQVLPGLVEEGSSISYLQLAT